MTRILTPRSRQKGFILPGPALFRRKPSGGSGDPYWTNVVSLLHFDDALGSTTFVDAIAGNVWSGGGGGTGGLPAVSATITKFGSGALRLGTGVSDKIVCTSPKFSFGTLDFTIECWAYITSVNSSVFYFGANQLVYMANGKLTFFNGSSNLIVGSTVTLNALHAISLARISGQLYLFLDGVQGGSSTSYSTNVTSTSITIGSYPGFSSVPYIDEFRCTAGIGRYSANYTPPTAPFPNHT